jgi:multiple sugar transport system ATP-binding protein
VSAGELRFDDVRMNDVGVADRDIAMVVQNYGLYPHISVYDDTAFGLRRRKLSAAEIDTRVRNTARMLDIEPLLARRPNRRTEHGRIHQVGTPGALYDGPVDRFVASFIGTPAMGVIDCSVEHHAERIARDAVGVIRAPG